MPDPPTGSMNWVNGAAKIRKLVLPVSVLVGITAASGAFVAGNDAVYDSILLLFIFFAFFDDCCLTNFLHNYV